MDFYVTKRNGRREAVDFNKIMKRLSFLSSDLKNINITTVAKDVISNISNGIRTTELDKISAQKSFSKSMLHPEYSVLAGRIMIDDHQKNTSGCFLSKMAILNEDGVLCSKFYDCVLKFSVGEIDRIIDYSRDFNIDYFGFFTLHKKYLLKNKAGVVIERPQDLFMRVAIQLSMTITNLERQLEFIRKRYDNYSHGKYTQATPTLFNSGLKSQQFASCVLITVDDNSESILKSIYDGGLMSKHSFGIGGSITAIRSKGEPIHGTNGISKGVNEEFIVLYEDLMKYFDQGGSRRPGSMALYMEMHHPDLLDFIFTRIQKPNKKIIEHVFPALWVCDLFMKRLEEDGVWSFFDPYKCGILNETFGDEYEKLYIDFEKQGMYKKQMRARDVFNQIYLAVTATGTPYLLFKDAVNRRNNQSNVGIIKCSNLCCEIVEYSNSTNYSSCNIASICLPKFVRDMSFGNDNDLLPDSPYIDWDELRECVHQMVDNLNNLIDLTWCPRPELIDNNQNLRPIGVGVQGLSDVYFKFKFPFESDDARRLNREIFEHIYFYALEKSNELAAARGAYAKFKGSPLSLGKFQFDLYDDFDYSSLFISKAKWDLLRRKIMKNGVYNSLLVTCMPTASTSQIQGNTEGIDPLTSNIYSRQTLAGEFIVINKYMICELQRLGLWNMEIYRKIEKAGGSIQNIEEIPQIVRDVYKTVWEIKQKALIDMAADRQHFIDQSQSMNLYFKTLELSSFFSAVKYGWKAGLKTGYYYMRTLPVDTKVEQCSEEVCLSCQS